MKVVGTTARIYCVYRWGEVLADCSYLRVVPNYINMWDFLITFTVLLQLTITSEVMYLNITPSDVPQPQAP